jgi:hypothetical protein
LGDISVLSKANDGLTSLHGIDLPSTADNLDLEDKTWATFMFLAEIKLSLGDIHVLCWALAVFTLLGKAQAKA